MNAIDLAGRTAIVTGAARGIGLATVQRLLASGAAVALWDIDAAMRSTRPSLRSSTVAACQTAVVDVTERDVGRRRRRRLGS